MKTLNQVIKDRKAKSKKKVVKKALSPEGEALFNKYIEIYEKVGDLVNEMEWPSHRQLDESSSRVKKMVDELMAKTDACRLKRVKIK